MVHQSNILSIFDELASISSRNEKIAKLKTHRDNEILREIFRLSLDPLITFGIKKIPEYTNGSSSYMISLENIIGNNELDVFIERKLTGNAAIDHLRWMLNSLPEQDAIVLERIIQKDTRSGCAEGTVNEVWPGLLFAFPIMKARPYDEKNMKNISFPAFSQTKLDGARCALVIGKGKVEAFSSSGRPIETFGQFDYLSNELINVVIDGELLVTEPTGKFMERKKGNGIVNKAVKGTISLEEAKQLHFVAFDFINLDEFKAGKGNAPYHIRLKGLEHANRIAFRHNVSIVETVRVANEYEAHKHFKKLYAEGYEGTILKDVNCMWEDGRSKFQIKFKGILTCDLRVKSVVPGTGKYAGMTGALLCESSDGELEVSVGTGLSDADRSLGAEYWVDKIVEVQYNERILSKAEGSKYALFLPRYIQVRIDKDYADKIENISEKGL